MLEAARLKILQDLINTSSKDELVWMNGYLSALVANGKAHPALHGTGTPVNTVAKKITIAYGTETGNSKNVATHFAATAKKHGIIAKVVAVDQYRFTDLPKEEYFFVVISTQGEGEPPLMAKKFCDSLQESTQLLPGMKFSVLALGDTAYPLYCKTGEDVDQELRRLGATPLVPLQKCDLDYEADAEQWFEQVINALDKQTASARAPVVSAPKTTTKGKKYYEGTVITNINLNDRGSNKQTFHIEIAATEPVEYEPGDSLAIVPVNKKFIVHKLITLTGIDPKLEIQTTKVKATAEELLAKYLNICYLLTSTIKKYAAITEQDIPDTRLDLVDLLNLYPVKSPEQFAEFLKILTPIAPRLYSISSSPAAQGNDVHLTVSKNAFCVDEEQRFGLCSEFMGELPVDTKVTFYIHKNRAFKLPAPDKDIIMIGPGTGIAPFRSFLAERDATGATGKNWLFFGEQHFTTDFLYQTEIQNYVATGVLNRVGLAFSRDQQEKIYVQHRMVEDSAELFQWLEHGAAVYVSGTKDPMSADVEAALLKIIEGAGGKSAQEALDYWEAMKKNGRYQKDVY